jgi:hypothetical protein
MLEDATLLELIGAIAADGYFPGEPLLVSPRPEGPSPAQALSNRQQQLTVVEGNRRLAAVRLLNDPALAPTRRRAIQTALRESRSAAQPSELPVIVFRRRIDVLDHLGFRHVTGIKSWSPTAKANYVEQLVGRAHERGEELTLEEIAKMIGSKGWYVGRLLATLAAVERLKRDRAFFKRLGVSEDELPFSLMLVALGRENIVEYLGLESANEPDLPGLEVAALKRLAVWLFRKRGTGKDARTALGESRNMTLLAQVVTSDEAMDALDAGESLRTAAVMALDPEEIFEVGLDEAEKNLDLALRQRKRLKDAKPSGAKKKVASISTKVADLEKFISPPARGKPGTATQRARRQSG